MNLTSAGAREPGVDVGGSQMSKTIGMWKGGARAEEDADWTVLTRRARDRVGLSYPPPAIRMPERAAISGEIDEDQWAAAVRRAKNRTVD
jgi:hypothetical protein